MISLNKALEMMRMKDERGRFVPFSIAFVSCDATRKTGGELVTYKHVTLPQRERVTLETQSKAATSKGNGSHSYSSTVTFKTSGGEFRQAHIHLITRFNGETVI